MKEVVLQSPDGLGSYKLTIPDDYLVHWEKKRSAMLKAVYPDMKSISDNVTGEAYKENGTWGDDLVRIFLDIYPEYEFDDRDFKNRNDAARFAYYGVIDSEDYFEREDDSIFSGESSIRIFESKHTGTIKYLISHKSGRWALGSCIISPICEVKTTWEGKFHIMYQFNKKHLEDVVQLDRSVFLLVESFNPALIQN